MVEKRYPLIIMITLKNMWPFFHNPFIYYVSSTKAEVLELVKKIKHEFDMV